MSDWPGRRRYDRLYTPWRYPYVTGQEREEGCLFCNRLACDEEGELILARAEHWFVLLNRYPYTNGHLLLALNRHQPALAACRPEELAELGRLLSVMEATLRDAYGPDGINCGYNGGASAGAGVPAHLHFHVLPRWQGDASFMSTVAGTRIMPETLEQTYARLRPRLRELLGAGP